MPELSSVCSVLMSSYEAKEKVTLVQRGHHPRSVMVWKGVSWNGVAPIHFCDARVKTMAKVIRKNCVRTHSSTLD